MVKARWFLLSLFLLGKGLLPAAPEVVKRGVPDGVTVAELSAESVARSVADERVRETDYLLLDRQVNVAEQTDTSRVALRIAGEGGLQGAGRWSVTFDPEYQEVWFHRIEVHRGGVVIDRLPEAAFRYLEQETDAAYHLYNGQVTALTLLPDLRVGDVVDVCYTIKGRNPVFGGRYFDYVSLGWGQPLATLLASVTAPESVDLRCKVLGEGAPQPELRLADGRRTLQWRIEPVRAVTFEDDTPDWYPVYPWAQISEFATWREVVDWALPLYEAGFEKPQAALAEEVAALLEPLGAEPEPEAVAAALLTFVQREIRYLGIELGVSSHRPHPPAETYGRRFGDCKDKAVLLVQLLRSRGIPAFPVLVNSVTGEALRERLPSPGIFDHVIVGIELDGELHWVDPTMSPHGGTLRHRAAPDYGWGLMIAAAEEGLRRIQQPKEASRRIESREIITSHGFEEPGTLQVISKYHGTAAISLREYFNGSTREQIGQTYQDFYASTYPEITTSEPPLLRDLDNGSVEVVENYTVPALWTRAEGDSIWRLSTHPLLLDGYLPYGLAANRRTPRSIDHAVEVTLRQELHLHEVWGLDLPPVDIEDAAFHYRRRAEGDGTSHLVVDYSYESRVPYVEAAAMPAYVQAVNQARAALGLELTWTPSESDSSTATGEFAPNLLMIVIALGSFVCANALLFWWVRHRHRGPPPLPGREGGPVGLGGWLILPAIGLVVNPFRLGYDIVIGSAFAFDHDTWTALTTPGLATTDLPLAVLILVEVVLNVALLVMALWCVGLFFRRDRCFPTLMRLFMGYHLLVLIGDSAAVEALDLVLEPAEEAAGFAEIVRATIQAAIWIPYFTVSQRVKNTFTR